MRKMIDMLDKEMGTQELIGDFSESSTRLELEVLAASNRME